MIKCDNTKLLLMDFLYGEIGPHSERMLRRHLEACDACRSEYEALSRTSLTLQAWKDEEPARELVFVEEQQSWLQAVKAFLFPSNTSWWTRLAVGVGTAVVTALIVSAALNLEISYDEGKWSYRASFAPHPNTEISEQTRNQLVEQLRQENRALINELVQTTYQEQRAEFEQTLANLTSEFDRKVQTDLSQLGRGLKQIQQQSALHQRQLDERINELFRVVNFPPNR